MVKQTIKKFIAVLLTAGICAGLFAAPVFAAEKQRKQRLLQMPKFLKICKVYRTRRMESKRTVCIFI